MGFHALDGSSHQGGLESIADRSDNALVLNYDPIVPGEGHRKLSEVFGWNSPISWLRLSPPRKKMPNRIRWCPAPIAQKSPKHEKTDV